MKAQPGLAPPSTACKRVRTILPAVALLLTVAICQVLFTFSPSKEGVQGAASSTQSNRPRRSLPLQSRWEAITACLRETPCAAHSKLGATPPPYDVAERHFFELLEESKSFRGLKTSGYAGYFGPWIENVVVDSLERNASAFFARFYPTIPIVVQQTDVCVAHGHLKDSLRDFLSSKLRPEFVYTMVTQHDWGLCVFAEPEPLPLLSDPCSPQPSNILHFSGGGYGNVPIPLILGDRRPKAPIPLAEVSTALYFQGALHGDVRKATDKRLREVGAAWGFPDSTFYAQYYGPDWEARFPTALLNVAPRGYGRSSFHSGEIAQMGLAQVFIWDDTPWAAYWHPDPERRRRMPTQVWGLGGVGFVLGLAELEGLRGILCDLLTPAGGGASPCTSDTPFLKPPYKVGPDTPLAAMRARAKALAASHFTYEGVLDRIAEFIADPDEADLVCRAYPASRVGHA